jgi:mannose-6-phosphate isomerase-like protein (cupin superfamily)
MSKDFEYVINLDNKFGYSTLIDIPELVRANQEQWYNQTLTQVNDSVVRLGILHGEFHWHKHDDEDEFFLVLDGELLIELEGAETVALKPQQGYTVPKGVMHKTRAEQKTVVLMVEKSTVTPTGS